MSLCQAQAQEPKVIYLYDDLGRLVQVVNQNNECATYEYDAVGNLLRITRSTNCLQPPNIDSLSQDTANAGDTTCLTIRGTNFLGATVTTDNPDAEVSRVRVSETSVEVCLIISPFATLGSARIIVTTTAGVVERAITINAKAVVITQPTSIGRFDRSFDGTNLTIQGPATVTIDGAHRFRSLALKSGAIVTHPFITNVIMSKLDLTVDGLLTIDATSKIDVTGRGFLGGGKPGNPFPADFGGSGMTVGFQRGSTGQSGGSYGGLGGSSGRSDRAESLRSAGPVYGDFRDPNEPGSGGASFSGPGGSGGGLIRIVVQTIQLDGAIKTDGETPTFFGAGSGGGIRIDVGMLRGTGTISANGGTGQRDNGSGGGGGRIAIYYQDAAGFDLNRVTAFGGTGNYAPNGGAGTTYLQGPSRENGELIADNNNIIAPSLSTPLTPRPLESLRIRRGAKARVDAVFNLTGTLEISSSSELVLAAQRLSASTMNVTGSSLITHLLSTASVSFKVDLSASTLTVDATSKIDVTGRGFLGGGKPGNPFPADFGGSGMTVGFQRGSTGQSGGSYGGLGGSSGRSDRAESLRSAGPVYGDFRDPNEPGSGGASFSGPGGSGGGLIRIVVQTIQLDGAIKTDGETPTFFGAGSGGGIRIDVGTLSGTGQITANGGIGQRDNGGGGAGGRIAIYYQNAGFDFSKVTAFGGAGNAAPNGGAGTIYLQGPAREAGELIADNNNSAAPTLSTPITPSPSALLALSHLRVRRGAKLRVDDQVNLAGNLEVSFGGELISTNRVTGATIALSNNGFITQLPTTASAIFKLDLSANTLSVDSTSRIDVTGLGFLGGGKPGNPFVQAYNNSGMTVGFQRGSTGQSGGSYGGLGGSSSGSSNPIYGDFRDPNEPGSGGAALFGPAGNGGGLIRIAAQTLQLDGMIKADGESPATYAGGSGGGIRIDAGTLTGTGTISANGGNGQRDNGGGGGGGRVAIYYQNAAGFDFTKVTAFGGTGRDAPNAGAGTVYLQGPGREGGEVVVDNNSVIAPSLSTSLTSALLGNLHINRGARAKVDNLNLTGTLEVSSNSEMTLATERLSATTIAVTTGSLITHLFTTASAFFKVDLSVNTLTIDATSRIDVTGRGFLGGLQPGNPLGRDGMTVGFKRGSTGRSGGSYGGFGGSSEGSSNPAYGDSSNPNEPGSGGATVAGTGGNGGGLIRIVAQTIQLGGMIKADGETPTFYGAGSGGGIRIDVGTFTGTGQITANGGNGQRDNGGGGGGGRIAIYYRDTAGFDLNRVTAFGGSGNYAPNGQNGSVITQQTFP